MTMAYNGEWTYFSADGTFQRHDEYDDTHDGQTEIKKKN